MHVEPVIGIVPAVLAVIASFVGVAPIRRQVLRDVELLTKLPEGSAARASLQTHVDRSVDAMLKQEAQTRTDRMGTGLRLTFLIGAAGLVWRLKGWK